MSDAPAGSPEETTQEIPAETSEEVRADKGSVRPDNKLSKPSDYVARPGFRNPANVKSMASRKKRNKKG